MENTTKERRYTTPEQKIEIINSPLSNIELAKIYGIPNTSVSQIRRRAGIMKIGGTGGAYNRKLTDDQIKEIIETTTPSRELAAKFHVTYEAVWLTRKKHGVELPKREQKARVDLSKEQKAEILKSKLTNKELAKIYDVAAKTISGIRTRANAGLGKGGGGYIKLTEEQRNELLKSKESCSYFARKFNVSVSCVSRTRLRAGITSFQVKKQPREKEVKPIKQPVKKRTINIKKTQLEEENIRREKALEISKRFENSDADKVKAGTHIWVNIMPRGRVLRKINQEICK